MRSAIIVRTDCFTLTSYGNGLAYVLYNRYEEKSVHFQGDDAGIFREHWKDFEDNNYEASSNTIMGLLWMEYDDLATNDDRAGDM